MMYQFHAKTDPGRCRENNEDSVAFDDQALVAVLADGMGGYNAGEVASNMAALPQVITSTSMLKNPAASWNS